MRRVFAHFDGLFLLFLLLGLVAMLAVSNAQTVSSSSQEGHGIETGVIIEGYTDGSEGGESDLQANDVILSWSREGTTHRIDSPFDWWDFQIEQLPRGPVTIHGIRNSSPMTWRLSFESVHLPPSMSVQPRFADSVRDPSKVLTRPALRGRLLLTVWQQLREYEKAHRWSDAVEGWRGLIAQIAVTDSAWLYPYLESRLGFSLLRAGQLEEANAAFQTAVEQSRSGTSSAAWHLLLRWGYTSGGYFPPDGYKSTSSLIQVQKCDRRSLEEARTVASPNLKEAQSLHLLGIDAEFQGDLAQAQEYYLQALAIRQKLAPESLITSYTLVSLGFLADRRADLVDAEDYFRKAVETAQIVAPDGLVVRSALWKLAFLSERRGELAQAEEYYRRILATDERMFPGSLYVAYDLMSLGNLALIRTDSAGAEDYYRRAEAIRRQPTTAMAKQIQTIYWTAPLPVPPPSKVGEDVSALPFELQNVGEDGRDWPRADDVGKTFGPRGSLSLARTLVALGNRADQHQQVARSGEYYNRALGIDQALGPTSTSTLALYGLARLACNHGEAASAEDYYRRALTVEQRVSPGSSLIPIISQELGSLLLKLGRSDEAVKSFVDSVEWVESRTARLGSTEDVRSSFRAKHAQYYWDLEHAFLSQRQPARAYQVSERYRAQSLLRMLAERDLVFASDVPGDLQRARKRNAALYDQTQAKIAELNSSKDLEKIDELTAWLRVLSAEREKIGDQIRKVSPRFASLQYPHPLDLDETRQILDRGTTLLSYSVGEEHTVLFVVQPDGNDPGLSVFTLPVKEKDLQAKVQELRHHIGQHNESADPGLMALSRQLYDLLLKPAESLVAGADRLLIVPDGPLQVLPFAALRRTDTEYLVEWKPLHTVVSATVYAELKKMRRSVDQKGLELAAFGDPRMPALGKENIDGSGNMELRFASERGFTFGRLPFSRQEVEGIAAIYPKRSQIFLGGDATEERAKALGKDVRFIHFATHGLLDERFPLNSALVLAIPDKVAEGKENGLLQAWEIFEQMRLDADLVTLSACNTGLGQELKGEGLIGLTRAFQYAGARSILASLWSVDDFRTMQLMKRFYTELHGGKPKDEALRMAQLELIHSHSASAPHYWAGFSLIGDWR
jgi:CHAT domain-containing protein